VPFEFSVCSVILAINKNYSASMTNLKKDFEQIFFIDRNKFRNWLEKNHKKSPGIWMIYYKKHTGNEGITYREALEEALCFGWIDSIIKKVDEERYVRKFTPRINTSNWSDLNKKIVNTLIDEGKMTRAGLEKIEGFTETGKVEWKTNTPQKESKAEGFITPGFIIEAFAGNEPALENFMAMAPSYKKRFVLWITSAKREETINNRLNEAVKMLKDNRKPGL